MTTIKAIKQALRKVVRKKLRSLSPESLQKESDQLLLKIKKNKLFQNSTHISLYFPMPVEVKLLPLFNECFKLKKNVYIPVMSKKKDSNDMNFFKVYGEKDFSDKKNFNTDNKYKILEPTKVSHREKLVDSVSSDDIKKQSVLFVVPGVAFDKKLQRLGNGKGFYDKYLESFYDLVEKKNKEKKKEVSINTIALCLSVAMVDEVPVDSHDRQIDEVLFYE